MLQPALSLYLPDETATERLGAWFAHYLAAGDCVLLSGQIGAGKSHFARALIRARLGRMEDVPSPTFTLVQTYDSDIEIWHADLYRLTNPDEVRELGLEDAFASAICLVEWPDRLGPLAPAGAIRIALSDHEGGRMAMISCSDAMARALRQDWPAIG
jgi:tRNA threonylcarbamoyladenosine biosynthesis protein TsaE